MSRWVTGPLTTIWKPKGADVAASYRQLHYAQRPAKNVERKMIVESLAGLDRLQPSETMRYIGFGSLYFTDFLLLHRQLAVSNMISIEKDSAPHQRERFELNRPFGNLEIRYGRASKILPSLDWSLPGVCWLDYDGHLDDEVLGDVESVVASSTSTTVLIVTVCVEPEAVVGDPLKTHQRIDALAKRIKADRMPPAINCDAHLGGWKLADFSYELLNDAVTRALTARTASVKPATRSTRGPETAKDVAGDGYEWRQFLHFRYSDAAKMLTIGGILHPASVADAVEDCRLDKKQWSRVSSDPFVITIPKLTTREVLTLDRYLPNDLPNEEFIEGIPRKESVEYSAVYRHLPAFVDAVL